MEKTQPMIQQIIEIGKNNIMKQMSQTLEEVVTSQNKDVNQENML